MVVCYRLAHVRTMKRTYIITAAVCCAIILAASFTDPIHDAASNGNLAGVQAELDKGVDVNLKTNIGVTPLHRAAFAGHKEVIELLIAKGADVNAQGITGGTPLDSAVGEDHTETADLLRKHGGKTGEELK